MPLFMSPSPLSRQQKQILVALTLVIAATRLLTLSASLMDWDEALFSLALREYDVTLHHPHPPGYPLFVAAANFIHHLGVSEFRALQVVVVLSAVALFPACFSLAREVGMSFATSVAGATIFSFLPNVWIYSGTGFSDIPATAAALAAATLLLRGRTSNPAYVFGAIVLAVAAGIRPTNLIVGALPAILATVSRLRARAFAAVALALAAGFVIVASSYGGAAIASESVDTFLETVEQQGAYVRENDSWRNPGRPPLRIAARIFLVHPFVKRSIGNVLLAGVLIALFAAVRQRSRSVAILLGMYVPLAVISWLSFDIATASRYAINYMALHALLTAQAFFFIAGSVSRGSSRVRLITGGGLTAILLGYMFGWSWEAATLQRTRTSPPVAALEWIVRNVPPQTRVFVDGALRPHAALLLHDRQWSTLDDPDLIPSSEPAWAVHARAIAGAKTFVWPRENTLWRITRRRNFEVSVVPALASVVFRDGWYSPEGDSVSTWRWMGKEGRVELAPLAAKGRLTVDFIVPLDVLAEPPVVTFTVNDKVISTIRATRPELKHTFEIEGQGGAANELVVSTSHTTNPAARGESGDSRELGLMLRTLSWRVE